MPSQNFGLIFLSSPRRTDWKQSAKIARVTEHYRGSKWCLNMPQTHANSYYYVMLSWSLALVPVQAEEPVIQSLLRAYNLHQRVPTRKRWNGDVWSLPSSLVGCVLTECNKVFLSITDWLPVSPRQAGSLDMISQRTIPESEIPSRTANTFRMPSHNECFLVVAVLSVFSM